MAAGKKTGGLNSHYRNRISQSVCYVFDNNIKKEEVVFYGF